jgi:tRNA threonylcarbamoyladenosine biosynthesis protein TsaE
MSEPTDIIETRTPEETFACGHAIADALHPGMVVSLTAPLGGGKTTLVQGIARGCGVPAAIPVTSPTFTLLNIYAGRCPIYHFDWYRLASGGGLETLGVEEYFDGDGVSLVEWGERFPLFLPPGTVHVEMIMGEGTMRKVVLPPAFAAASRLTMSPPAD